MSHKQAKQIRQIAKATVTYHEAQDHTTYTKTNIRQKTMTIGVKQIAYETHTAVVDPLCKRGVILNIRKNGI